MKKFISIFLVLALCCSLSVTAFADDLELTEDNPSGECTIEFYVPSSYCIVIPETIHVYNNFNYRFSALNMNLRDDEQVNVYCDNLQNSQLKLYHKDGDYMMVNVEGTKGDNYTCVATFRENITESDFAISFSHADWIEYHAGEYTGTVEFTVSRNELGVI